MIVLTVGAGADTDGDTGDTVDTQDSSVEDSGSGPGEIAWDDHLAEMSEGVSLSGACPTEVPSITFEDGRVWSPTATMVVDDDAWIGVWRGRYHDGEDFTQVLFSPDAGGSGWCVDSLGRAWTDLVDVGYDAAYVYVTGIFDLPGLSVGDYQRGGISGFGVGDHSWLCLEGLSVPPWSGPGDAVGSVLMIDETENTLLFATFEVADCIGAEDASDPEWCDGLDNDLDGEVDEGGVDRDGDGVVDCPPE